MKNCRYPARNQSCELLVGQLLELLGVIGRPTLSLRGSIEAMFTREAAHWSGGTPPAG